MLSALYGSYLKGIVRFDSFKAVRVYCRESEESDKIQHMGREQKSSDVRSRSRLHRPASGLGTV